MANKTHNVIPRNFNYLRAISKKDDMELVIRRNEKGNLIGTDGVGKTYLIFPALLRDPEIYDIIEVRK